ncbi:branched-chain amino acid ABC transporter permease [Nocardioides sediminis]|uniref:branched-chain amino acid ABC transporter permease n=1 Tax=Nocardioides sediminis TaxID=433648 RepID=UPI001900482E|nr:branched-chain amino acid ABC transporter permease [Nocardioides sediminis]
MQATFISFLVALSIQFPMRMGVFSFAGVANYALGAYTAAIVVVRSDEIVSPVVSVGAGVLVAVVVSLILALIVRRLRGLYLAMATISVSLIVQVIAFNGGELTGGASGMFGVISDLTIGSVIVVCVVAAGILTWTERGTLGRRIDAVRDDPELAVSMGINVNRYRLVAFVGSGVFGSLAGGLEVLLRSTISPVNVGFSLVVTALTIIIVGGYRSWVGAAIGAVIVTWLPFYLQAMERYQQVIYGLFVVVAAIFVPGGLLGIADQARRRLVRRQLEHEDQEAAAEQDAGGAAVVDAVGASRKEEAR